MMARDGVVFRIDAAAVGSSMFSTGVSDCAMEAFPPRRASMRLPEERCIAVLHSIYADEMAALADTDPSWRSTYLATLRAIAWQEDELASAVAVDLLAAPAAPTLLGPVRHPWQQRPPLMP